MLVECQEPLAQRLPSVAEVASDLAADLRDVRPVPSTLLPADDADLAAFCRRLVAWASKLTYPEWVVWVQPLGPGLTLTLEEAEQILGLVSGVKLAREESSPSGRRYLVLGGQVRLYAVGFVLRWSRACLESWFRFLGRLSWLWRQHDLARKFVHFIELPSDDAITPRWVNRVHLLLRTLGREVPFGVFLPRMPFCPERNHTKALRKFTELAETLGVRHRLVCQWVGDVSDTAQTAAVLAFARQHGFTFDFSLSLLAEYPFQPVPYQRNGAYFPLDFDLWKPAFVSVAPVIEVPRLPGKFLKNVGPRFSWLWSGTRLQAAPAAVPLSQMIYRLEEALDRPQRRKYLERLKEQPSLCRYWHHYHVYNWAPPPGQVLRVISLDAEDLGQLGRWLDAVVLPEQGLSERPRFPDANAMLGFLRHQAMESISPGPESIRRAQIAAHQYLATGGREKISPDGERLLAMLPASLGRVLELGFGYGLTAERVSSRAAGYYGIDLQTSQARAFRQRGGCAVVADMHALPFGDGQFDTVIADNALEHAYDPLAVLREVRRVLRSGGRLYALVPLDGLCSDYQIRSHLWKVDERGLREAVRLAGLKVIYLEILDYTELRYLGCFPASHNKTCLVILEAG
ncbi:MAG TPA: class I SAM-dependent methyltransferase [Gemmataceae bacterium]|nr:class I SAM-dependent methyltransferase [Gemmataceae bacterium]